MSAIQTLPRFILAFDLNNYELKLLMVPGFVKIENSF